MVIGGSELRACWLLARASVSNEAAARQGDSLVFEFSGFIAARSSSVSDPFLFHPFQDHQNGWLFLRQPSPLCHQNLLSLHDSRFQTHFNNAATRDPSSSQSIREDQNPSPQITGKRAQRGRKKSRHGITWDLRFITRSREAAKPQSLRSEMKDGQRRRMNPECRKQPRLNRKSKNKNPPAPLRSPPNTSVIDRTSESSVDSWLKLGGSPQLTGRTLDTLSMKSFGCRGLM